MSSSNILAERLDFMRLDEAALSRLRNTRAVVMEALPDVLDGFYAQILAFPEMRALFSGQHQVAGARSKQLAHWDMISNGRFDEGYVRAVTAVGQVHARIGLEPRWYIGGYALVLEGLIGKIVEALWPQAGPKRPAGGRFGALLLRPRGGLDENPEDHAAEMAAAISAIVKATLLDMDFAISVYLEAAEAARLKAEQDVLAKERAAVVASVGEAMAALARGEVAYRMPDTLPTEYGKLRDDFNVAAARMHDTMKTVLQATHGIRASVGEVAQASNDLARRAEEQAASLEESAATTEELAASVKSNAQSSRHAEAASREAMAIAERGGGIARQAVEAMTRIEEASRQIADITSMIDGLAFQTNLLALNAAVESARAGEAGKGFAVVASEVRTLAQRSGEASRNINALIAASNSEIVQGVTLVRSAGDALEKIVDASKEVAANVSGISAGSSEQANGIDELSQILAAMDGTTQHNAVLAEQNAASIASLSGQIVRLDALIAAFKVDDGPAADSRAGSALAPMRRSA